MLEHLIQGVVIGASAGLSPGPLLALLIGQAVRLGWRRTLPAAFAPLLSDGPIILFVLLLLSQVPDWFVSVLRIAGGLFLLTLAWGLFRAARSTEIAEPADRTGGILKNAVLINLLNPNPYIFWSTVLGPNLVAAWRVHPGHGLAYAGGFYAAMIAVFSFWIVAFGSSKGLDLRIRQMLTAAAGVGMAGFAVWQLLAGLG